MAKRLEVEDGWLWFDAVFAGHFKELLGGIFMRSFSEIVGNQCCSFVEGKVKQSRQVNNYLQRKIGRTYVFLLQRRQNRLICDTLN